MHRTNLSFQGRLPGLSPKSSFINHGSTLEIPDEEETSHIQGLRIISENPPENHFSLPTIPRKRVNIKRLSSNILPKITSQTPTASSNGVYIINKRLTRGYTKFLEEAEFINRRNTEKQKVYEEVKKKSIISIEDNNGLTKEVQSLITATIVNESCKNQKPVMKPVEGNNFTVRANLIIEKHKRISSRILGPDFKDNELFFQKQEERSSLIHSLQSVKDKSYKNNLEEQSPSRPVHNRHRRNYQSFTEVISGTMTSLAKGRSEKDEIKMTEAPGSPQGKSLNGLNMVKSHSIKAMESIGTLNDFEEHMGPLSQTKIAETEEDNILIKERNDLPSIKARNKLSGIINPRRKSTVKLVLKKKRNDTQTSDEINTTAIIRTSSTIKKTQSPVPSFVLEEEKSPKERNKKGTMNLKSINNVPVDCFEMINKLCSGMKRSTNRLGAKLKRQQSKIVKDYSNLDVQMELLNYDNTIENWEKSLKKVQSMEQKGGFLLL